MAMEACTDKGIDMLDVIDGGAIALGRTGKNGKQNEKEANPDIVVHNVAALVYGKQEYKINIYI